MKSISKLFFFLLLGLSLTMISCGSEGEEELKGIQVVTSRSNVETEGVGLACNFSNLLKGVTKEELEEAIEESRKEVENDPEFDKDEFDEFFDKENFDELFELIFGSFDNKTFYTITTGELFEMEFNEEVSAAGEGFSISWLADGEEPTTGIYDAKGVKINIEDPDDLENGAEFSIGDIQVTITELSDEFMVGAFDGTVSNKEGVDEAISGAFNVERMSCTE